MALDYQSVLFDSAVVSSGSNDDLFTLGTKQSVDNLVIRFSNYTGTPTTVSIWVQASAGTEADGDNCGSSLTVGANDYIDVPIPRMVGGGNQAKLTVTCDTATAVAVSQISGIKRT